MFVDVLSSIFIFTLLSVYTGAPAASAGLVQSAPTTTTAAAFFELVIGDTSASGTRKLAASLPHPEAVSLLPVLALWDVILMGRVEEMSAQAGSVGLPVEADGVSLINSSRDLESSPIRVHELLTLGRGELGGGGASPDRDRVGPSQRCSTSGQASPVVTTEEDVDTRDTHQHSVSVGAVGGAWTGLGLSAPTLPRYAAKVINKR